jgi:ribosomal protein S18 acetylase RimI-like enzyme
MTHRLATASDFLLLGELNHQLIQDEGHRNPMTPAELSKRMETWLATEYRAVIFEKGRAVAGYALFREMPGEIYLRQLFVVRGMRRQGLGRAMVERLKKYIWPKEKRFTVEVLVANDVAVRFWRALGYRDYALTLEILPGNASF